MNLLGETEQELRKHGYEWGDVDFIGSADGEYSLTLEHFAQIANAEYDNSYGSAHVAEDLVVVFTDGSWLERREYDGSEWWELSRKPRLKDTAIVDGQTSLVGRYSPHMGHLVGDVDAFRVHGISRFQDN